VVIGVTKSIVCGSLATIPKVIAWFPYVTAGVACHERFSGG
jgi:hypothetical protein